MRETLYPDENPQVHRRSSIDQFGEYLSVYKQGGWAPIIFDKLDGIGTCSGIKSHPVVVTWDPIGYVFPESHCTYENDTWITVDKKGVETVPLPECMGPGGFYERYIDKNAFIGFDTNASLGVHNKKRLRVGTDLCLASETLPAVD